MVCKFVHAVVHVAHVGMSEVSDRPGLDGRGEPGLGDREVVHIDRAVVEEGVVGMAGVRGYGVRRNLDASRPWFGYPCSRRGDFGISGHDDPVHVVLRLCVYIRASPLSMQAGSA